MLSIYIARICGKRNRAAFAAQNVGEDVKGSESGHAQLIADDAHLRLHLRIYTKGRVCIYSVRLLKNDSFLITLPAGR